VLHLDVALEQRVVEIRELPRAEVRLLEVLSRAELPIYIPAGLIFRGGKQNRICAKPTLVMPGESREVPVNCVQHGRWSRGHTFGSTTSSPLSVTSRKLAREHTARKHRRDRTSDQRQVWSDVSELLQRKGVRSTTEDLTDHGEHTASTADVEWTADVTGVVFRDKSARIAGAEFFGVPSLVERGVQQALASACLEFGPIRHLQAPMVQPLAKSQIRICREVTEDHLTIVDFEMGDDLIGTAAVHAGCVLHAHLLPALA